MQAVIVASVLSSARRGDCDGPGALGINELELEHGFDDRHCGRKNGASIGIGGKQILCLAHLDFAVRSSPPKVNLLQADPLKAGNVAAHERHGAIPLKWIERVCARLREVFVTAEEVQPE